MTPHKRKREGSKKPRPRNTKRPKEDPETKYPCPVEKCVSEFSQVGNLKQHVTQVHLGRCRYCGFNIGDTMFKSQSNEGKGNKFGDKNVKHVEQLRRRHERDECSGTKDLCSSRNAPDTVFNEQEAQSWCDAMEQWTERRKEKGAKYPKRPWSELTYELIQEACVPLAAHHPEFQNPYNLEGDSESLTHEQRQETLPDFDTDKPQAQSDSGYGSLLYRPEQDYFVNQPPSQSQPYLHHTESVSQHAHCILQPLICDQENYDIPQDSFNVPQAVYTEELDVEPDNMIDNISYSNFGSYNY